MIYDLTNLKNYYYIKRNPHQIILISNKKTYLQVVLKLVLSTKKQVMYLINKEFLCFIFFVFIKLIKQS